jgi:hypothetical protein
MSEAFGEPVPQPAHAVTPPEPAPVVTAPVARTTHELVEEMNSMLRMQVLVAPIIKHADDSSPGQAFTQRKGHERAQRRRRELPPTEWEVCLFEGGRMPVPKGQAGSKLAETLNSCIQEAAKPYLEALTTRARSLLDTTPLQLEQGKALADVIWWIGQIREFQVLCSGGSVLPKRGGFRTNDKLKAEAFAAEVNAMLRQHTDGPIAALRAEISERLKNV